MRMLCMRARPLLSSPFSLAFLPPKRLKTPIAFSSKSLRVPPIAMSTVEHVVLFKVKEGTDPSKVNAMVNGLNGLVSLESVLHLSAGPVLRTRSSTFDFTHMLHSRYGSKEDLGAYSAHPDHMGVVKECVLPIIDDIMAVDWVADRDPSPISPPSGSAVKISFLKLKESVADEKKEEILEVIKGIPEGIPGIQQITCGENFSPARAKGFSIASIAVFGGIDEMDAAEKNEEFVSLQKDKVRDCLDGVIVVDYVVPSSSSSNL